jgi:hypothetical protein
MKNQFKDKNFFKNLDTLPFYCIPKEILAQTPEQIAYCTAGSGLVVPDWID